MPRNDITILKIGDVLDIVLNDELSRGVFINDEHVPNCTDIRLVFCDRPELHITGFSTGEDGEIVVSPSMTDGLGNATDIGAENIKRVFHVSGEMNVLINKKRIKDGEVEWEFDEWIPLSCQLNDSNSLQPFGPFPNDIIMGVRDNPVMTAHGKSYGIHIWDKFVVSGTVTAKLELERFVDPATKFVGWKNGSEGGTNG